MFATAITIYPNLKMVKEKKKVVIYQSEEVAKGENTIECKRIAI